MAEGVVDVRSLQELFQEGWGAQKNIENDEFSSNSEEFKVILTSSGAHVNIIWGFLSSLGIGAAWYRMFRAGYSPNQPVELVQLKRRLGRRVYCRSQVRKCTMEP